MESFYANKSVTFLLNKVLVEGCCCTPLFWHFGHWGWVSEVWLFLRFSRLFLQAFWWIGWVLHGLGCRGRGAIFIVVRQWLLLGVPSIVPLRLCWCGSWFCTGTGYGCSGLAWARWWGPLLRVTTYSPITLLVSVLCWWVALAPSLGLVRKSTHVCLVWLGIPFRLAFWWAFLGFSLSFRLQVYSAFVLSCSEIECTNLFVLTKRHFSKPLLLERLGVACINICTLLLLY